MTIHEVLSMPDKVPGSVNDALVQAPGLGRTDGPGQKDCTAMITIPRGPQ